MNQGWPILPNLISLMITLRHRISDTIKKIKMIFKQNESNGNLINISRRLHSAVAWYFSLFIKMEWEQNKESSILGGSSMIAHYAHFGGSFESY